MSRYPRLPTPFASGPAHLEFADPRSQGTDGIRQASSRQTSSNHFGQFGRGKVLLYIASYQLSRVTFSHVV